MNKRQKEVLQVFLDSEKDVLKKLEENYKDALADINSRIEILMARQDADMAHVIYQVEHQRALRTQVQAILENLQTHEFESISEYLANAYTDGFIGTMYDIHGQGVPLIIPIDQKKVVAAIQHDTKLSESLYTSLGHDIKALRKEIASEISRGISTGQDYVEIARNIEAYAKIPKNRAMTIARTESHRIQCKATSDAQYEAKKKGANVVKQWDSTMDKFTRDSHRELDGQIRELDEPFNVNGHEAMFPGDFGRPEEDVNCRCALLQRAKWALDKNELNTLKEKAAYFKLDKTEQFEDFKKKYMQASESVRLGTQRKKSEGTQVEKPIKTLKNQGKSGIMIEKEDMSKYIGKPITKTDNQSVREWYHANVHDIPNQIDKSKSFQEQVEQAYNLRNKYKHEARVAMSDRETAERLERKKPAKSFDELLQDKMERKKLNREEALRDILETASKTNADVDKEFGL